MGYKGVNCGYRLVDKKTGKILKYGESISPETRYTQTELDSYNAKMEILVSGSKAEIHQWQHDQINAYKNKYGQRPPLNKSDW